MGVSRMKALLSGARMMVVCAGLVSLAGCAGSGVEQTLSSPVIGSVPSDLVTMQGIVHGGNLPVSGATIQLWAVGTGGYGSAPTPLISTANSYYPGGATGCSSSQSFSIQSFSIASNVVTFQGTSTVTPPVYSYVTIAGLNSPAAASAGLDGQTLIVTSSSSTQFTAAFVGSNVSSTSDSGTATQVCTSNVITNYAGGFTLSPGGTRSYACTAGTMLYLTGTGGNPGLGEVPTTSTTANNTGLAMMIPVGNCSNLTTSTTLFMNEVTTVAAVYALQNYIGITPGATLSGTLASGTPAFRIGAGAVGSKSYQGLINAFELAANMVNTTTGVAANSYTPVTGGGTYTSEYYQVNALANVLAGCVNNATNTATGCTQLFTYATPPGTGNAPVDTLEAIWDMAQNPTNNATNIVNLATAQAPFVPFASSVNDLTIGAAVTYGKSATVGYYMFRGFETVVDGFGNIWVSSTGGVGGGTQPTNLVAEFDPAGQPLGVTSQYNTGSVAAPALSSMSPSEPASGENSAYVPMSITVDPNNNVWVADFMDSQIIEIPASTGAGVVSQGLNTPTNVGTAAKYNLAYALTPNSFPSTIASDKNGNIYVAYQGETYTSPTVAPGIVGLTAASIAQYSYNGSVSAGPLTSATEFTSSSGPGQALNGASATIATATPSTADSVTTVPTSTAGGIGDPLLSIVFDYSSGYRGSPLAWMPDGNACGSYGSIVQFFGATDSTTTPTITQGEATPLSLMADAQQTSCKVSTTPALETSIASTTGTYNGATGTTYGPAQPFAAAIDPSSNVWVLNQRVASSNISGYPGYSYSKLTPTYTTTSGVLSGTVSALTVTSGSFYNMVGTGGGNSTTHIYDFNIDSAGNAWFSAAGYSSVVPETGNSGVYTKTGSFIEFNNAGIDVSSQYYQSTSSSTPSSATPVVPPIANQFGFIGANPTYTTSLQSASYRGTSARFNVAIDLGGSLWTPNASSSGDGFNILLGGAAPTLPPISLGNPTKP